MNPHIQALYSLPRLLRPYDLTPTAFLLLHRLVQDETRISMAQIATLLGFSTAASTGIVDRLERQRYVVRENVVGDRRKTILGVTRKGINCVEEIEKLLEQNAPTQTP